MDYKILFFLVIILLLILYLIKEIYFVKFDLLNYINTLKNNYEENNLILRKNFQNDLNVFANKIKLLNDENLQQFRKITLLNTQPIVKNNNYFKEMTESETCDNGTELKYFSDSRMMSNKNDKNTLTKSYDEDISRTSNIELLEKHIFSPQNKIREFITSSTSTNSKNSVDNNNLEFKNGPTIESSVVGFHVIDDSDESEESDDLELETLSEESSDNENNEENNSKQLISEESDEESLGLNETLDKSQNNNINNINYNENDHIDENDVSLEDTEISFEKKELEPQNTIIENKITKEKLLETAMDNITLGTKKSKNEKKNQPNHLTEIKTSKELSREINKENFKTIDDYTLEHLKNIAKKFNIPISAKISGRWKLLNKTEIYSEISKYLNKNI